MAETTPTAPRTDLPDTSADPASIPPMTQSAPPEQELEQHLRRNPHNLDAKVDVGSDQSMDASDPPAASQPGQSDEPVPSSGYPDGNDR